MRGALQGQGAALQRSAASLALGYIRGLASLKTQRSVLAAIRVYSWKDQLLDILFADSGEREISVSKETRASVKP